MKNTKKGVSLIVLVITIIVIIIIAAAVILGLTKSNPINNSKIASMTNARDSIYSTVNMHISQITAKTQGNFTLGQIITGLEGMNTAAELQSIAVSGKVTEDPILGAGVADARITVGQSTYKADKQVLAPATTTCMVNGVAETLYQIDRAQYNLLFKDAPLPSPASADSSWYVSPTSGKIYLIFTAKGNYPQWMLDGANLENNMAVFTGYVGSV